MPSAAADDFNWDYWQNVVDPPRQSAAPPEEIGLAATPATDNFDWEYWKNLESPPRQSAAPLEEHSGLSDFGDQSDLEVPSDLEYPSSGFDWDRDSLPPAVSDSDHLKIYSSSDPGSSPPRPAEVHSYSSPGSVPPPLLPESSRKNFYFYHSPESESEVQGTGSPKELEPGVERPPTPEQLPWSGAETPEGGMSPGPPASPASTDLNLPLDHQALSTGTNSQPANLLDAVKYELKGKAKVSGPSGTARDVGNAVQRELQRPAEKEVA
jgi:hypothetical protein